MAGIGGRPQARTCVWGLLLVAVALLSAACDRSDDHDAELPGSSSASGEPQAPVQPPFHFDYGTAEGWAIPSSGGGQATNAATVTDLSYDDSGGSLAVNVALNSDEGASVSVALHSPLNLTGKWLVARVHVPENFPPGKGAFLFTLNGAGYVWEQGPWLPVVPGVWNELYFEIDEPEFTVEGYPDRADVRYLGVRLGPPEDVAGSWVGVFHVDAVEIRDAFVTPEGAFPFTFDYGTAQGWAIPTVGGGQATSAATVTDLSYDDSGGSLAVNVALTTDEGAAVSVALHSPLNLAGKWIVARVHVPENFPPGKGAFLFTLNGADYVWEQGPWLPVVPGVWNELYFEIDEPEFTDEGDPDRADVRYVGVRLGSPEDVAGSWVGVFHVDAVEIRDAFVTPEGAFPYTFDDGTTQGWEVTAGEDNPVTSTTTTGETVAEGAGALALAIHNVMTSEAGPSVQVTLPVPARLTRSRITAQVYIPCDFPAREDSHQFAGGFLFILSGEDHAWEGGQWTELHRGKWNRLIFDIDRPFLTSDDDDPGAPAPDHTDVRQIGIRLTTPLQANHEWSGVVFVDSVTVEPGAHFIDLAMLDGADGLRIDGIDGQAPGDDAGVGDLSGTSVAGAGDVNGDGFEDLIVGAPGADSGGVDRAGESYVIYGGAALPTVVDLASLDGSNGVRLDGDDEGVRSDGRSGQVGQRRRGRERRRLRGCDRRSPWRRVRTWRRARRELRRLRWLPCVGHAQPRRARRPQGVPHPRSASRRPARSHGRWRR